MNKNLFDNYLTSMNFLNEACINFPEAISFSAGRPREDFFDVLESVEKIKSYVGTDANGKLLDANFLGQYNKTKGIINEEIARLLKNDEKIIVDAEDIMVTDGAQEAMTIIIDTLFDKGDVLLVSDPSYIGFIGYAKIAGLDIRIVKRGDTGIDFDDLESVIRQIRKENKNPRALYEVPNFHNPTGKSMTQEERRQLLEVAQREQFYIIEDNPYGYFSFDGERKLTLKAMDKNRCVIYIGSFAKSIFPAMRMGYLIADQQISIDGHNIRLIEECKKVKSFVTVNTSTVLQAVLGGILKEENYSLLSYCEKKVSFCRQNRDVMAREIKKSFDFAETWEKPEGGFFASLPIPFNPTEELILKAAKQYGVIVCPMSMFCLNPDNGRNTLRLSYSYITTEQIVEGIGRLAEFIKKERG